MSGDSQWSSVHGFKTDITDQTRRDVFRVLVVPAAHEAGPAASPSLCVEYVEQDLTRDSAECGDDVGLSNLLGQRRCTRRRVGDDQLELPNWATRF